MLNILSFICCTCLSGWAFGSIVDLLQCAINLKKSNKKANRLSRLNYSYV